jgi:hypothetical protein
MNNKFAPGVLRSSGRVLAPALVSVALAVGAVGFTETASAQVGVSVDIGVPPPPPRYEVVPAVPVGYIWAPGYWEWFHGTHVWRRGHMIEGRPGYRWSAERWEFRDGHHHFEPGRWENDPDFHGHRR